MAEPFEGKGKFNDEVLAAQMQRDLVGREISDVRVKRGVILIVLDTDQEIEFKPEGEFRFQGPNLQ